MYGLGGVKAAPLALLSLFVGFAVEPFVPFVPFVPFMFVPVASRNLAGISPLLGGFHGGKLRGVLLQTFEGGLKFRSDGYIASC